MLPTIHKLRMMRTEESSWSTIGFTERPRKTVKWYKKDSFLGSLPLFWKEFFYAEKDGNILEKNSRKKQVLHIENVGFLVLLSEYDN